MFKDRCTTRTCKNSHNSTFHPIGTLVARILKAAQSRALPFGQAFFGVSLEDSVFDSPSMAIVPFFGVIAIFIDSIDVRPDLLDLGLRVEPTISGGN